MVAVLEVVVVVIFGRLGVPKLELGASRERVASWSMRALAIHNQPLIRGSKKNNHSFMFSVHEGNLISILVILG